MKIISVDTNFSDVNLEKTIACIGYFDGFHVGHMKLVDRVFALHMQHNLATACICFDQDPYSILSNQQEFTYLTPHHIRMEKLRQMGFDYCYLLRFDMAMANLSIREFHALLQRLQVAHLVCGSDFAYGAKGKGNVSTLQSQSFALHVQSLLCEDGAKVSSSFIEEDILQGRIEQANYALNYAYSIDGVVVKGSQVGKKLLGFATANLHVSHPYVIPKNGVYAGVVKWNGKVYKAMINIGHNPTMNFQSNKSIEAHILHFDEDIYGESICISFYQFIRDEQKFDNIEALICQLHKDLKFVEGVKDES